MDLEVLPMLNVALMDNLRFSESTCALAESMVSFGRNSTYFMLTGLIVQTWEPCGFLTLFATMTILEKIDEGLLQI